MNRFAIAVAAMIALTGAAKAEPWEYQGDDQVHEAWQGSKDGEYVFAFACEGFGSYGEFYVATPEPYEETTSYADRVPTIFTADGRSMEVNGVFEERAGSVSVFFPYTKESATGLDRLFAMVVAARGDIGIRFFDKNLTFASEGLAAAFEKVAAAPGDCRDP